MFKKLGGRKLVAALIVVAAGLAVDLLTERGLSSSLKELLMFAAGMYTMGNVGKSAAEALRAKKEEKLSKIVDTVQQDVTKLNQNHVDLYNSITTNNQAVSKLIDIATKGRKE